MPWRRPRLWPTLFTVPALALLVGLGLWQLERLDQKTAILERIEAGLAAAPAPLPATVDDPFLDCRIETATTGEQQVGPPGQRPGRVPA